MKEKSKSKKESKTKPAGKISKPKKPSYPKAMTIRYDKFQEKQILQMMDTFKIKTMSKAFLAAPGQYIALQERNEYLERSSDEQFVELEKLRAIAEDWKSFNKRLSEWAK